MKPYKPQGKTAEALDRAYQLVLEAPYKVSARWLFYQLLQEGYYSTKADYKNKFSPAISDARKRFYKEWRPDTLIDDRRVVIRRGDGWDDPLEWLEAVAEAKCQLDKWNEQKYYVEIWFEANAMKGQFEYYTKHITLRPMGGQPSIPYKFEAAKDLEASYQTYGKPIIVLYFGDLDEGGENIMNAIEEDVAMWCEAPYKFVRCGLNREQVEKYGVPENLERPGAFQWEALKDEYAKEIIEEALEGIFSLDVISEVEERERQATQWLTDALTPLLSGYTE